MVGLWAVVLAAVWLFYAYPPAPSRRHAGHNRGRRPAALHWPKPLVVSLLAAGAFYSSPFSVLPLPFFAVLHWRLLWRHVIRTWMFAYTSILALIPLFLFLHRPARSTLEPSTFRIQFTGDFWLDKLISLPFFMVLVPIVEFAALPFLLLLVVRSMKRLDRWYFAMTVPFFVLTYFVAFSNTGNLSIRGMLLPTFVLFYLFAKYSPDLVRRIQGGWRVQSFPVDRRPEALRWTQMAAIGLFVVATSVGALKMAGVMLREGWINTSLPYDWAGVARPKVLDYPYRKLVFDGSITKYTPSAEDRPERTKINTEKLIEGIPIEEMETWERELLRTPRQGFY